MWIWYEHATALGCSSKGTTPSHVFPRNVQYWILKPCNEDEINKLRICYKHFHDSDYSGIENRRLNRLAISFMISLDPLSNNSSHRLPDKSLSARIMINSSFE